MNFQDALRALVAGKTIRRSESDDPIRLQSETVAILTSGLVIQSGFESISNNWLFCRYPMIKEPRTGEFCIPRSFSDEELVAQDWEVL